MWMQSGSFMRIDVWLFGIAATSCLIAILGKKSSLNVSTLPDVKLYALARPYMHIVADFFYYSSLAASLTTLVFIWSRSLPLITDGIVVPAHTAVLIVNFFMFAVSMGMYSIFAKRERATIEGSGG